jgi:hypothetical protein
MCAWWGVFTIGKLVLARLAVLNPEAHVFNSSSR